MRFKACLLYNVIVCAAFVLSRRSSHLFFSNDNIVFERYLHSHCRYRHTSNTQWSGVTTTHSADAAARIRHGITGRDGSYSPSSLSASLYSSCSARKSSTSERAPCHAAHTDTLCSCITARRRRKAGRQPFYGTGWAARPGNNNAQPYYGNNNNATNNYGAQQPAPPYTAPNSNAGYYGGGQNQGYYGQQNGVELQSPQPTYGGNGQYAPPPGPPPGKGDGYIR